MIIHLPDPAAAHVQDVQDDEVVITVQFGIRDAAHRDSLLAILQKAERDGYGIELRLIHYEGQRDMIEQAKARRERKAAHQVAKSLRLLPEHAGGASGDRGAARPRGGLPGVLGEKAQGKR